MKNNMKIKPYKKICVGPMYFDNSVMDHNTRTPLNQTGKKKKHQVSPRYNHHRVKKKKEREGKL